MVNDAGSSKVLRFMRCVIADETYCLNMSWVRSIQRTEQFHQQQGAEGGVIGWYMSSSGKIPVLGLAAQLNGHSATLGQVAPSPSRCTLPRSGHA